MGKRQRKMLGNLILIESQWNLNLYNTDGTLQVYEILIESQWNLNLL